MSGIIEMTCAAQRRRFSHAFHRSGVTKKEKNETSTAANLKQHQSGFTAPAAAQGRTDGRWKRSTARRFLCWGRRLGAASEAEAPWSAAVSHSPCRPEAAPPQRSSLRPLHRGAWRRLAPLSAADLGQPACHILQRSSAIPHVATCEWRHQKDVLGVYWPWEWIY